ncbi:MAG: hypothetical protein A3A81_06370 [Omnitrophica bacterium RIFCSPLOWO2_01_FULL_45_10b]|nr:MAG: hypothetical protein A3A81_06370 [Omnitrophica bacterium RIFCSPLOWO2_01_FULL_45_10b]
MELPFVVHPIFVHFPIAFYLLELILLFFWLVKKEEYYFNFALFAFRIGYSSMIIAMIAGFIDTDGFEHIQGRVRTHFISALTVFTLYTLRAFFWRFGRKDERHYRLTHLLLAAAGNILVALTGYFGGMLVYS